MLRLSHCPYGCAMSPWRYAIGHMPLARLMLEMGLNSRLSLRLGYDYDQAGLRLDLQLSLEV